MCQAASLHLKLLLEGDAHRLVFVYGIPVQCLLQGVFQCTNHPRVVSVEEQVVLKLLLYGILLLDEVM